MCTLKHIKIFLIKFASLILYHFRICVGHLQQIRQYELVINIRLSWIWGCLALPWNAIMHLPLWKFTIEIVAIVIIIDFTRCCQEQYITRRSNQCKTSSPVSLFWWSLYQFPIVVEVVMRAFHYVSDDNIAKDQSAYTHVLPACPQMGKFMQYAWIMCNLMFIMQIH